MSDPIFISPRWLELLAQRMRNAGLDDVEINETDWIVKINQMINAGIENEFVKEEIRLVKMRMENRNVWETGSPVHEQKEIKRKPLTCDDVGCKCSEEKGDPVNERKEFVANCTGWCPKCRDTLTVSGVCQKCDKPPVGQRNSTSDWRVKMWKRICERLRHWYTEGLLMELCKKCRGIE